MLKVAFYRKIHFKQRSFFVLLFGCCPWLQNLIHLPRFEHTMNFSSKLKKVIFFPVLHTSLVSGMISETLTEQIETKVQPG